MSNISENIYVDGNPYIWTDPDAENPVCNINTEKFFNLFPFIF